MKTGSIVAAVLLLSAIGRARADYVVTNDGTRYEGAIVYQDGTRISLRLSSGEARTFTKSELRAFYPIGAAARTSSAQPMDGAPQGGDDASGTKPASEPRPEEKDPAEAAMLREWSLLGRNLSGGFSRSGATVRSTPNRAELAKLAQSEQDDVRTLARTRFGLELLRDRIVSGRRCTSDFEREIWAETFTLMAADLPSHSGSLREAFGMLEDPNYLLIGGLNVVGRDLQIASLGLIGERELRDRLREVLQGRIRTNDLTSDTIRWKFRPVKPDDALLMLTNGSKKSLNHCFVVTELTMDHAKTDAAAARQNQRHPVGELIAAYFEISESVNAAADLIKLRWDYEAIERGTTTYLERWGAGQSVTVGLSPLLNLMVAGSSARVDIYSDEGHVTLSPSVSDMQETTWKVVKQSGGKR